METMTNIFDRVISQAGSFDIAEAEFRHLVNDDPEVKEMYKQWCVDNGYSQKYGFIEYCEHYRDSQDSVWESLSDYDDDF